MNSLNFLQYCDYVSILGILAEENPSKERVIEALTSLKSKIPSRKIVQQTGLGHLLNKYRKENPDEDIKKAASETYRKVFRDWHREKPT